MRFLILSLTILIAACSSVPTPSAIPPDPDQFRLVDDLPDDFGTENWPAWAQFCRDDGQLDPACTCYVVTLSAYEQEACLAQLPANR
jgi:hypothetical protein